MTLRFEDRTGQPRSLQEYRDALTFYSQKIVSFDMTSPQDTLYAPVVIELLKAAVAHLERARPTAQEGKE